MYIAIPFVPHSSFAAVGDRSNRDAVGVDRPSIALVRPWAEANKLS